LPLRGNYVDRRVKFALLFVHRQNFAAFSRRVMPRRQTTEKASVDPEVANDEQPSQPSISYVGTMKIRLVSLWDFPLSLVTWPLGGPHSSDVPNSRRRPHSRKCTAVYYHEEVDSIRGVSDV
jgi:hypothetical protein